jgi:hypothetical protein
MRDDQHRLLTLLGHLPARLTAEQVATVLNCQAYDVPVLVAARLLKPLGNPAQNATKFFATQPLLELMKDEKWLHRATAAMQQYWHNRNARKKDQAQSDGEMAV